MKRVSFDMVKGFNEAWRKFCRKDIKLSIKG